jgi:hypothetical protein
MTEDVIDYPPPAVIDHARPVIVIDYTAVEVRREVDQVPEHSTLVDDHRPDWLQTEARDLAPNDAAPRAASRHPGL